MASRVGSCNGTLSGTLSSTQRTSSRVTITARNAKKAKEKKNKGRKPIEKSICSFSSSHRGEQKGDEGDRGGGDDGMMGDGDGARDGRDGDGAREMASMAGDGEHGQRWTRMKKEEEEEGEGEKCRESPLACPRKPSVTVTVTVTASAIWRKFHRQVRPRFCQPTRREGQHNHCQCRKWVQSLTHFAHPVHHLPCPLGPF